MGGLSLVAEARKAGLRLRVDGGRLIIRGPRSQEALAKRLLCHKAELMSLLAAEARKPDDWDEESKELIRFFQDSRPRLPTAPYRLTRWLFVESPPGWYTSLELDISFGPHGCRARMGALQEDLRLLREHVAKAHHG
jgi:hypothetical protein